MSKLNIRVNRLRYKLQIAVNSVFYSKFHRTERITQMERVKPSDVYFDWKRGFCFLWSTKDAEDAGVFVKE